MRKPRAKRDSKKAGARSKKLQDKMVVAQDVSEYGEGCRRSSPPGEAGREKSCRLRWIRTDKRPDLNRENFGEDEEDLIIKLHALLGNRWSLIAGRLPGCTDDEVENYWNSHLKRKLVSMGIDPNNHRIYHTLPRRKNEIPMSNSDDGSTCGTSAVSKAVKYHDRKKIHDLSNGTNRIELSATSDKKVTELPD